MPSTEERSAAQRLAPGRAGVQGAEPPGFSVFLYVVHCDAQKAWAKRLRRKWPKRFAKLLRVIAHARAAPRLRAHAAMALAALTGDEQCIIFSQLCNPCWP